MGSFIIYPLLLQESSVESRHRDQFLEASIVFHSSRQPLTSYLGVVSFHNGLTHASKTKPTVIEAEHDTSLSELHAAHCEPLSAQDCFELGIPLERGDSAELGISGTDKKSREESQLEHPEITPETLFPAVRGKEMALGYKNVSI